MRDKTIWLPCQFCVVLQGVENEEILFLTGIDLSQESFHGNYTSVIWFLCLVPSLKGTASIFLQMLFIQYVFSCKSHDTS